MLTWGSGCPELHHFYHMVFGGGNGVYLGLLRVHQQERDECNIQGAHGHCFYSQCWKKLVLFLPAFDCMHGIWCRQVSCRFFIYFFLLESVANIISRPSLGSTMTYVRILAIVHFVFGVVYAVASLTIAPEQAGPFVLLVILPLSATLTAFYIWTLNSLKFTMADLLERKQNVKALMYRRLWWLLLASILVIFGFFFLNSLTFAGHGDPEFGPSHWKTRWFVLDGWLNLVYLVDLAIIAYLWRPTANNRRFAMSDELAQDDEGFEIASLAESDDEDSAEQGYAAGGSRAQPPTLSDDFRKGEREERERMQAEQRRREMAEGGEAGEPIFSVEDDSDRWSEDEVSSDDDKKHIKKESNKKSE